MAQECGFFNAELEGGEYDRVYNAEQFAAYFASFIGNGVFGNSMSELVVVENETPNMSINVSSGQAWINGWWYRNTEDYNLSVEVADGLLNRKDIVVLRWGNVERDMWLQVVKGTPSMNPVAPTITRNADYYDLKLCEISIPAGAVNIRQAQITDTRPITEVCGFVTGLIDQIDAEDLFLQLQSQFNIWFDHMKDQLSEDAAGHLQQEIDDISTDLSDIWNVIYPIGSLYMSVNSTDPSILFGGTWSMLSGGYVLKTIESGTGGSTNAAGNTGSTRLTAAQSGMQAHSHGLNNHTHRIPPLSGGTGDAGQHTHVFYAEFGADGNVNYSPGQEKQMQAAGVQAQTREARTSILAQDGKHLHSVTTYESVTDASSGNTATYPAQNASEGHSHTAGMPQNIGVYVWVRTA